MAPGMPSSPVPSRRNRFAPFGEVRHQDESANAFLEPYVYTTLFLHYIAVCQTPQPRSGLVWKMGHQEATPLRLGGFFGSVKLETV